MGWFMDKELTEEILQDISKSLDNFPRERRYLIHILQMIHERYSYLPADAIKKVARYLGMSACEIYGVATFYNQFRFNPPGRHPIKVCLGTACHVRGGDVILENFERKLGIKEGETTPDREFSIERVACIGCCALAPVAVVDETVHGHMAPSKVEGIILGYRIEKERREREKNTQE
ncbi:MAG: NADH-quinone oxidoreductase subunit NuoE [Deltaproteobacteria bacterium]|nr:NADH-quinone oxidoreductase subunit NuoE [Deltaproteobacteria bacterium]